MKHPLLNNLKLAVLYSSFWVFVSVVLAFIQWFWYGVGFGYSLFFTSTLFLSYAIIGSSIWFTIQNNTFENNTWYRLLSYHLVTATIITVIWMYITSVILKIFIPGIKQDLYISIPARAFIGYILYVGYVVFFYAVTYYENLKDKVVKESELKSLVKEAELHALKSQINPHFLFNSLNSISSLTMSDPKKAQEMVINLSSLMRYSLKHRQSEKVEFCLELENNKLYLEIEKVRFGKRLNPVFDIDEGCQKALVPNMILQPLYENAIKYGVYEATEPVDIITRCRYYDNYLEISISNTYDPNVINTKGEGIGLRNIRERLQIIYGNPGLIKINDSKGLFIVTLMIPQT
ncbi:MAG: hypothetical protein GXO81_05015 [Chlorobi bacterium]|nr:hypothetical protein [Chlorobiota bacterium]